MSILLHLVEFTDGQLDDTAQGGLTFSRLLADQAEWELDVAVFGDLPEPTRADLGRFGADRVYRISHPLLTDYGPDAWAESLTGLALALSADAIVAAGTERGNEVMAHVGALLDQPMVANSLAIEVDKEIWQVTRIRWGGSLHEVTRLAAPIKLATVAPHNTTPSEATGSAPALVSDFTPDLSPEAAVTLVRERAEVAAGVTLANAPVVVSGGRGVGSAEGFGVIEELAGLLGGAVGCSRVVTNNGWKNHRFQVGQTGTVVAPELYVAAGISGAIQHWVGMMNAQHVLAVNVDPDAPMVTKADWAVIGDLHEVLPAISAEIRARRSAG